MSDQNKQTDQSVDTKAETVPTPITPTETNTVDESSTSDDVTNSSATAASTVDVPVVTTTTENSNSLPTSDPVTVPAEPEASTLPVKQYAIAIAIVALIGLILWYGLERQGRVDTNLFSGFQSMMASPAAVVNGKKISRAEYQKNYDQIVASATSQGLDVTNESIVSEIKTQAIDQLVNTKLLREAATAAGIEVTDEQVEARYQEVLTGVGGPEQLAVRMAEIGLDEATLRSDIRGEILIQTHLAAAVDVSDIVVSEEDVTAIYEQAAASTDVELPPLETVRAEIEANIRLSQEQARVNEYIQSLRDSATIEVNV